MNLINNLLGGWAKDLSAHWYWTAMDLCTQVYNYTACIPLTVISSLQSYVLSKWKLCDIPHIMLG